MRLSDLFSPDLVDLVGVSFHFVDRFFFLCFQFRSPHRNMLFFRTVVFGSLACSIMLRLADLSPPAQVRKEVPLQRPIRDFSRFI